MKDATEEREGTLKLYETNAADLRAALDALEGAIKTLKGSKRPSLVQLQSISETLQTAAVLADALGLSNEATNSALAFLQQPENKVQMEDYKFHSDGIIKTLEGLLADFKKEKISVDEAEVSSVATYDRLMQDKTHAKKMKNQELEASKKAKAKAQEDIAATNEQLSTVEATLLDDKDYTNTLSKMCSDKAKTWDQRSRVRADELATLTQAIGVIKGASKEANQKGFCDKATADAEQKRDYAAEEIKTLNGEMAKLEATRDTLNEELDTLADEIQELETDRTTAEKE